MSLVFFLSRVILSCNTEIVLASEFNLLFYFIAFCKTFKVNSDTLRSVNTRTVRFLYICICEIIF